MKYITRKGIIMTSVGGQQVLVSAAALHDQVPYVTNINETTALCWGLLSCGATEEELINHILEQYDTEAAVTVRSDIHTLFKQLYENGYIVKA